MHSVEYKASRLGRFDNGKMILVTDVGKHSPRPHVFSTPKQYKVLRPVLVTSINAAR